MNVLFIDKSVPDFQVFVDSVNSNTLPIVYTNQSNADWILPDSVNRIGIVFIQGQNQLFGPNNAFLSSLIRRYSIRHIDFLACNTLPRWQPYYDQLSQETGVLVGASSNQTGNLQYGGDWTMESTREDIERIYFTQSIEYYKYLLDIGNHSMIIKNDGTIWAAGVNTYGELGIGTSLNSYTTFQQSINMSNIISIVGGTKHTIALKSDGTVWTAGDNSLGQLGYVRLFGDMPVTQSTTFNPVINMSSIVAIAGGNSHSIALRNDGTVWTTGDNAMGQLGYGKVTQSTTFRQTELSNITSISGGGTHSIALNRDGTVWTTGDNTVGQLGYVVSVGPLTKSTVFQPANNMSNIVAIAGGGSHSIALKSDGTVWTTGDNSYGQLGNGTYDSNTFFQHASNISDIVAIAGGGTHSLALKADGTVWTTGSNIYGELGYGPETQSVLFKLANNMSNIVSIAGGDNHSIALKNDGTVWIAGLNSGGQLGNGTLLTSRSKPFQPAVNMSKVISLTSKPLTLSAPVIKSDGSLYTTGNNMNGQSGTNTKSFLKALAYVDSSVSSVGTTRHGMVYLKNNQAYYSGYNQEGELGTTLTSSLISTKNVNPLLATVTQFSSGLDHSLFLTPSTVYASGLNTFGQLGIGNNVNTSTLTEVPGISNPTLVETGYDFSAVVSNQQVYTFGNNTYGQLGLGNNLASNSPSLVPNMSSVSVVTCGSFHTLFLSNNRIYSCGLNTFGQLGLETSISQTSPVLVSRLTNIVSISAGGNNSAALDSVGNLWLWGQDYTSTPVLTQSQVTYVNVTLNGIFYIRNNTYNLLKGDRLTFSYSDGQITLPTGQTIPFSVRSNICFLADTPVSTDQGDLPIVNLQPNKHTIRGKRIVAITETFSTEEYLVVVEKDAFFTGCPSQKTVMSKEHKVFYQGKMIEVYLLVNDQTIHKIPYKEEKLYNVLLEDHGRMKVNNMIVETLDPANTIGKVFKAIHEALPSL